MWTLILHFYAFIFHDPDSFCASRSPTTCHCDADGHHLGACAQGAIRSGYVICPVESV